MIHNIQIESFLQYSTGIPVIDVRSPAEFEHAHIPEAVNIPLFNNDERAVVGTLFKKNGQREAVLAGLEIAGHKIRTIAEEGIKASKNNKLLLYCWRGGMRSSSVAWLFEKAGIQSYVLQGGYKSYRRFILDYFSGKFNLCVLGGMTGSGKSEILVELEKSGYQVVHLEKIAHHKGSVFGSLGESPQKSNEQFENDLFSSLNTLNPSNTIWIEDESRNIGHNVIPYGFFKTMSNCPLIVIEIDKNLRVKRLVEDYGRFSNEDLSLCVDKIARRLGGLNTNLAGIALLEGKPERTANIVLDYYDKTYRFGLTKRAKDKLFFVTSKTSDPKENALLIVSEAIHNKLFKLD